MKAVSTCPPATGTAWKIYSWVLLILGPPVVLLSSPYNNAESNQIGKMGCKWLARVEWKNLKTISLADVAMKLVRIALETRA